MKKNRENISRRIVESRRLHTSDGFTIIEVMIGALILCVALLAIGTMQVSALKQVGSPGIKRKPLPGHRASLKS
jgi:prepilin-type N-terminal cleavage/methylation domain-containing protein